MTQELPTISISGLRAGGDLRTRELAKLRNAAEGPGFFLTEDYQEDIPQGLEDEMFLQARGLFSLPFPSLRKIALLDRQVDRSNRGYEGLGAQSLNTNALTRSGDLNYSYRCTMDRDPALDIFIPNPCPAWAAAFNKESKWPDPRELPGFKAAMLSYVAGNWKTSRTIFRGIEEAFGMPENHIVSKRSKQLDTLRLLWYPDMLPTHEGQVGCGMHTDFGIGTIVRRRGKGCLKVRLQDGSTIDVRPDPYQAIINFGDMLQWYTGGVIKSNFHGVDTGKDDISLVVFWYADPWAELVDGKTAGEYQSAKISESYRHHRPQQWPLE